MPNIDETKHLEELMEAQEQLKTAAATIDRIANKVHGNAAAFSNLEKERLRHQKRANDEAVINSKINEDFDLAMEEWGNERRVVQQVINKWKTISKEKISDNMSYHIPTILAILRDLRICGSADQVPNAKITGPETDTIPTNQRDTGSGASPCWTPSDGAK